MSSLCATAQAMMAPGKGLLAMDESVATCNRRFAALGIAQTEDTRRRYRALLVSTPGLAEAISGAILFDETLHQRSDQGVPLVDVLHESGILVGVKLDLGAVAMAGRPGERVTEGLDGLRERLGPCARQGVRFAKWRAVLAMGDGLPSRAAMATNAHALARYAALCQEAQLVPIVEPELLMDGAHDLARCGDVMAELLHQVFDELHRQGVQLEAMVLKPAMVLPGAQYPTPAGLDEVAAATLRCLRRSVPAAVAGIAFLSGGQPAELATARLNAVQQRLRQPGQPTDATDATTTSSGWPWPVTFSFGRALQQPALGLWAGDDGNRVAAQQALLHRARCNGAAARGAWHPEMEAALGLA